MKIPFIKAHGTGNDFIIFLEDECPLTIRDSNFIKNICNRHKGVGADSVLVLSNEQDLDYRMDYYNSDGSWETMCANGARCAAMVMYQGGKCGKQIRFVSGDGEHQVEILNNKMVRLKMSVPRFQSEVLKIEGFLGRHVDSGATHFVTEVEEFSIEQATQYAPKIRYSKAFYPRGINVNFYEFIDISTLKVISYEKGVEKVMLSCGSGSVAAAFYAEQEHRLESPLTVQVSGGELVLEFDEKWQNVWLTGPAVIVFESNIDINVFE